jgi:uncharacterized protein (TIGR00369 family)
MVAPSDDRAADDVPVVQPTRIGIASPSSSESAPAEAAPASPASPETPVTTGTLPSAGTPAQPQVAVASPTPPPVRSASGERAAVRFPPPAFTIFKGAVLEHAPPRLVRVRYPVEDWTLNPYGSVQDGMIAAMVDNVVAMLAHATDPLRPSSTLELSVRYFRAIRSGHVTVDGAVLRAGRTTVTMECLVWDDGSELCAKATATNLFVG